MISYKFIIVSICAIVVDSEDVMMIDIKLYED